MEKQQVKQENILTGTVGAFLGSILGGAAIILVSQLGYFASVCGLIMAVCTLKGYELLGGRLTRKGAVISSVLILVMTYVSYQLDISIEVARELSEWFDISVFQVFRSIMDLLHEDILDAGVYWGNLAMLYLFTLLGAVPTILSALRGDHELMDAIPAGAATVQDTVTDSALQFYPAQEKWVKPVRMSLLLPLLLLMLPLGCIIGTSSVQDGISAAWVTGSLLTFLFLIVLLVVMFRMMKPLEGAQQIFVRGGRDLFRVDLNKLNAISAYHFTNSKVPLKGLVWDKLKEEERERAKASIRRGIQTISQGSGGPEQQSLRSSIQYLPDPQLEKENKWIWTISYAVPTNTGETRRKKMEVVKMYPNFTPVYNVSPQTGPLPIQWPFVIVTLVISLGISAILLSTL